MRMLLQLYKGIQHTPTPHAAAAHPMGPSADKVLAYASKHGLPDWGLQLQMLTDLGDGQIKEFLSDILSPAAAARMPETAAAAAAAISRRLSVLGRASGSCRSTCCAACCEVLQCMTVVVLGDKTGAAATDTQVLTGELQAQEFVGVRARVRASSFSAWFEVIKCMMVVVEDTTGAEATCFC
jgi:hypothetical protein